MAYYSSTSLYSFSQSSDPSLRTMKEREESTHTSGYTVDRFPVEVKGRDFSTLKDPKDRPPSPSYREDLLLRCRPRSPTLYYVH